MPPIRTASIPIKPTKTERSHEENQERAYIAASRRSDRSLEARVESARRASEIHKKRTGRSLRVREEDVLNEEMYEEEDDDLPMQFRRLSALNPGGFHERLSSYMTTQLGMRAALHHAIYQANQQNTANNYLNSILATNGYQPGMLSPHTTAFPTVSGSPVPAPSDGASGTREHPLQHLARHTSMSAPIAPPGLEQMQQSVHQPNTPLDHAGSPAHLHARSMSFPTQNAPHLSQATSPTSYSQNAISSHPPTPHGASAIKAESPQQVPSPPQSTYGQQVDPSATPLQSPKIEPGATTSTFDSRSNPLTTQLPNETQQLINGYQFYDQHAWNGATLDSADDKLASIADQKSYTPNKQFAYGNLDQTLTRHAYDLSMPSLNTLSYTHGQTHSSRYDPDLGFNGNFDPTAYDSLGFGDIATSHDMHSGNVNLDPIWNPDEFVDYQD